MKKKLPIFAAVAGVAAVAGYRLVKGHSLYNRVRFKDEHAAIARYLETNHPGATYSSITNTGDGFYTIINDENDKYMLTITKTEDGTYVYHEDDLTVSF